VARAGAKRPEIRWCFPFRCAPVDRLGIFADLS
jgi:hypothetical protein